jgi:chromosome segregation ATPase
MEARQSQLQQAGNQLIEVRSRIESSLQKLTQTQAQESSAQVQLAATQARLSLTTQRLAEATQRLEDTESANAEASDHLAGLHEESRSTQALLERLRQVIEECEPRQQTALSQLAATEQCIERLHSTLQEKEAARTALQTELDVLKTKIKEAEHRLQAQQSQETAAIQHIQDLEKQQQRLQESLAALHAGEKIERARYEELRDLAQTAAKENAAEKEALTSRLECARQELADLETRMQAFESWAARVSQAAQWVASAQQDAPAAAAQARNELEISLAGLRHLLNQRTASPGPAHAPVAAGLAQDGSDPALLSSRMNRLRENIQREEARLQQLQRERARLEARPRGTGPLQAAPALREKDQKLEEKIRLNEARLELLEARLRRGLEDEKRQKEKLATLAQQLAEMRARFSAKPVLVSA